MSAVNQPMSSQSRLKNNVKPYFQPMHQEDIANVVAIEIDIYEFPWTYGNFCDSIRAGYQAILMLNDNHLLIGYAILMLAVDEAHLLNLSVARCYQQQGYGSQFLQYLMDLAKTAGMDRLILEVRPSNPSAARLYRYFGFKQIGIRKDYYPAYGKQGTMQREDALVMEKIL